MEFDIPEDQASPLPDDPAPPLPEDPDPRPLLPVSPAALPPRDTSGVVPHESSMSIPVPSSPPACPDVHDDHTNSLDEEFLHSPSPMSSEQSSRRLPAFLGSLPQTLCMMRYLPGLATDLETSLMKMNSLLESLLNRDAKIKREQVVEFIQALETLPDPDNIIRPLILKYQREVDKLSEDVQVKDAVRKLITTLTRIGLSCPALEFSVCPATTLEATKKTLRAQGTARCARNVAQRCASLRKFAHGFIGLSAAGRRSMPWRTDGRLPAKLVQLVQLVAKLVQLVAKLTQSVRKFAAKLGWCPASMLGGRRRGLAWCCAVVLDDVNVVEPRPVRTEYRFLVAS
ncbi:hypothetical protein PBRA_009177, partial [Plasmodiophora brassicae]